MLSPNISLVFDCKLPNGDFMIFVFKILLKRKQAEFHIKNPAVLFPYFPPKRTNSSTRISVMYLFTPSLSS